VDLSHGPRADTFARAGQSNDVDGEEAETKSPQPISMAAGFLISAMMQICR
jgi:hypothetical protein